MLGLLCEVLWTHFTHSGSAGSRQWYQVQPEQVAAHRRAEHEVDEVRVSERAVQRRDEGMIERLVHLLLAYHQLKRRTSPSTSQARAGVCVRRRARTRQRCVDLRWRRCHLLTRFSAYARRERRSRTSPTLP